MVPVPPERLPTPLALETGVPILPALDLYSRNGTDITRLFRALSPTINKLRAKSAIFDCELVACDEDGLPSFRTLMNFGNKAPALRLWCFDLLHLDGVRLMPMPLEQRKAILKDLIAVLADRRLQF